MKKYLLLFVFTLTVAFVNAQNIEADPVLVTEFEQGYLGADDRAGHSTMTNTASSTKTFAWVLEEVCNPGEYQMQYCDKYGCYLVDEGEITLEAGETSNMDLHMIIGENTESAVAKVTLTEVGNPDNTVSVTYEKTACTTGTEEIEAAQSIVLYPNPVANQFTLTENTVVENVRIYNILGSVVKNMVASSNNSYDVTDLETGIYMVQLLGEDSEVLRTMKMNKL